MKHNDNEKNILQIYKMKNNIFAPTLFICEHFAAVLILYTTLNDKTNVKFFSKSHS